jgi:hypothetical protein
MFASVTSLKFRCIVSVAAFPANDVVQRISLFNYTTNLWELVDVRGSTSADNTITVTPTGDPNRFIQAGTKRVRARIGWVDPGTLVTATWFGRIDETVWLTEG